MTEMMTEPVVGLDPLGDAEAQAEAGAKRNFAKVGSARPSSLLYTYGPGAIVDLPQFTVMPAGLDDWERIWARRDGIPHIHAPRLLDLARVMLGWQVTELRPFPWQPKPNARAQDGRDLGVPARVFPQWLRCTGCDLLGPLTKFEYRNTHPYRTDEACFEHVNCPGRRRTAGSNRARSRASLAARRRPAVPARYLLVCTDGHADEFPYDLWVHRGQACAKDEVPTLKMTDVTTGRGTATVECTGCGLKRSMSEALGEVGRLKLPRCRGRHPHLDGFDLAGCGNESRLMLVGASNLWFATTQSVIVMPHTTTAEARQDKADQMKAAIDADLADYRGQPKFLRNLLAGKVDVTDLDDTYLMTVLELALSPAPSEGARLERQKNWDPIELLLPEWAYLQRNVLGPEHNDPSGLMLSSRSRDPQLPGEITRVLAVDKLRKVNALFGFTRVDAMDRVNDLPQRMAPLTRTREPTWTVATEDHGEGVFLELDETRVAAWEGRVEASDIWAAHVAAHRRNYQNRYSETASAIDPDVRMRPPRYWLVHTLAHLLIREMAMQCGYAAASLSERLYAWTGTPAREAAAGLLICTTASDSDGTLGGLVQLSEPARLARVVNAALHRAKRCSSDPICATRTPRDPEDFLHGAACHCCAMASETSCERANRFLDRRFVINLPGSSLGFFG
jgi:hypothetical protein